MYCWEEVFSELVGVRCKFGLFVDRRDRFLVCSASSYCTPYHVGVRRGYQFFLVDGPSLEDYLLKCLGGRVCSVVGFLGWGRLADCLIRETASWEAH
jgi:hypothetical protein